MSPELGHFALILALVIALTQAIVPLVSAARGFLPGMRLANQTAYAQVGLITLAFATLILASLTNDFSVLSVVENSHTLKPVLYKIAGVWGNHEGSLVLWVEILALFGAGIAWFGKTLPPAYKARTLAVQAMIGVGFLAFILCTSNPFARIFPPPSNGNDLNPLLQDPGLAFHPPCLYLGYVGFSIVFSLAVAALIEGRVDAQFARWMRPWVLAAWIPLTIGIAMGSWWAYYTLGWGGWWFWDPVENASLMPWLAGTALLHSAIVTDKRGAVPAWTVLLAIIAFSLSLLGTFLVRSGVLSSVHAFASDPQRGIFILVLLGLATGSAFTLYAVRAGKITSTALFAPISRESALIVNNLLLITAAATVLIGTLYPLFLEESQGQTVSIGPPYFNATIIPLAVPLVLLLGIGPLLSWQRADLKAALQRLRLAALIVVVAIIALLVVKGVKPAMAPVGFALSLWTITSAVTAYKRVGLAASIAHAGFGIALAGITASSLYLQEQIQIMRPGDQLLFAGYTLRLDTIQSVAGPNYTAVEAVLQATPGNGRAGFVLKPQRRFYPVQGSKTTYAAIHPTLAGDLYVSIGDGEGPAPQAHVVRATWHPLVWALWLGGLLMALGGAIALGGLARQRIRFSKDFPA